MNNLEKEEIRLLKKNLKKYHNFGFIYLINYLTNNPKDIVDCKYSIEYEDTGFGIKIRSNNYCYFIFSNKDKEVVINYDLKRISINKYIEEVFNERRNRIRSYKIKKQLSLVEKKQIERKRKKI